MFARLLQSLFSNQAEYMSLKTVNNIILIHIFLNILFKDREEASEETEPTKASEDTQPTKSSEPEKATTSDSILTSNNESSGSKDIIIGCILVSVLLIVFAVAGVKLYRKRMNHDFREVSQLN